MRLAYLVLAIAVSASTAAAKPRFPTKRAELAGTWTSDDGKTYIVARDGSYTLALNDGRTFKGRWSLAENHILEITQERGAAGFSRILGYATAADGTTELRLTRASYAFTATPRECPCITLRRPAPSR